MLGDVINALLLISLDTENLIHFPLIKTFTIFFKTARVYLTLLSL